MSNKFLAFFQLRLSRSAKKKANVVASKVKVEKEESDEDGMMASQLENLANFHSKVCISFTALILITNLIFLI